MGLKLPVHGANGATSFNSSEQMHPVSKGNKFLTVLSTENEALVVIANTKWQKSVRIRYLLSD